MKTFFPPFFSEFGYYVVSYLREVHFNNYDHKIVSCKKGEECLFPSASEFFYDWEDIQDLDKSVIKTDICQERWPLIIERARSIYGQDIEVHYPSFEIRFKEVFPIRGTLKVPHTDICICARRRGGPFSRRNFQHWQKVVDFCNDLNLTVCVVGKKETTCSDLSRVPFFSFDYEDSSNSVVSFMQNSSITLTTDCGLAHLNSLLCLPQIVIENVNKRGRMNWILGSRPDLVTQLPFSCYKDPQPVFDIIKRLYDEAYFSKHNS